MTRIYCPKCGDDFVLPGEGWIIQPGDARVECPNCHTVWLVDVQMFEAEDAEQPVQEVEVGR